ncbi:hypothetical protein MJ564_02725 [Escherichia coli]|nr:hypothetical protein MJ564_02725 [Escherichia coli]
MPKQKRSRPLLFRRFAHILAHKGEIINESNLQIVCANGMIVWQTYPGVCANSTGVAEDEHMISPNIFNSTSNQQGRLLFTENPAVSVSTIHRALVNYIQVMSCFIVQETIDNYNICN